MSHTDPVQAQGETQSVDQPSVHDVLHALQRATNLNLRLLMQVQNLDDLLRTLGDALQPVLVAHLAGDAEQTKTALDVLVAKYVQGPGLGAAAPGVH